MNGPISSAVLGTTDVQAPGAPLISNLTQVSNGAGSFDVQLPGADADGSALTGLKGLNYVAVLGNDPLAGQTADQIVAGGFAPTVITLSDSQAGTAIANNAFSIPVAGQPVTVYCWCND